LVSATTHLALEQLAYADRHLVLEASKGFSEIDDMISDGVTVVTGQPMEDGRTSGVDSAVLKHLFALAESRWIPLLVEADGSRERPLKAPGSHEPPIPDFANLVVVVAGLSGLDKPLEPGWVHRPERFAELTGLSPGDRIGPDAIANVLVHPEGGLKNIPSRARRVVLLNQASTPNLQAQAQSIAGRIFAVQDHMASEGWMFPGFSSVLVANLKRPGEKGRFFENHSREYVSSGSSATPPLVSAVHERVAGVVLAGGSSSRLGQPKQLLPWRGQPLVRTVAQVAVRAGLSQVIIVTGSFAKEVKKAVQGLPVTVVQNPDWASGQSTSLRTGLRAIHLGTGGVIFLLADQPQVPVTLLRALVDIHAETLAPIVAPTAGGRRANPVLFDQATFEDLSSIRGDAGGRQLFARYPVTRFKWHDESILLDVDTIEDYQRLLELE
jgi:molybdenum cofactor cytidylyltransferase